MFVWRGGDATREGVLIEQDVPGAVQASTQLSGVDTCGLSPVTIGATGADKKIDAGPFWSIFLLFVAILASAVVLVEWLDRAGQLFAN